MSVTGLSFRRGTASDLSQTFAISARTAYDAGVRQGILPAGGEPTEEQVARDLRRQRGLFELMAAQPGARCEICEEEGVPVGYARVVPFGEMEQLAELMVEPGHQGQGIGRALLERCWSGPPTPERGRIVIATGAPADLTLYADYGVKPVAGHWHLETECERYLTTRAAELEDGAEQAHVLEPAHAVAEWDRLEPEAIGHRRPALHEFFGRDRSCLACVDTDDGRASALCWISAEGEVGPAVGAAPKDLAKILIPALDRIARTCEPERLSVYVTSVAWGPLERLRRLGFRVWWPSWIMCSRPLPGLDRYAPTRPPTLI